MPTLARLYVLCMTMVLGALLGIVIGWHLSRLWPGAPPNVLDLFWRGGC